MRRFSTQALSLGSLAWTAHPDSALAMNSIGAKSKIPGEGGEDPACTVASLMAATNSSKWLPGDLA